MTAVGPPTTLTAYLFAISTTVAQSLTFATGAPAPNVAVQNPMLYGPQIIITKMGLTDGVSVGEIQYIFNTNSIFGETRMATDPWDTLKDGLYIVSSVRGTTTGVDFSNLFFQSIFIKISATTMTLIKYGYFNMGLDNTAFDLFVSQKDPTLASHHMFIFGRARTSTSGSWVYSPFLFKMLTSDFTAVSKAHATNTNAQFSSGTSAWVPPTLGRISVCEKQSTWVAAYQKNSVQTGTSTVPNKDTFMVMMGHTGEAAAFNFKVYFTTPSSVGFNPNTGGETFAINFMDLYYKCETTAAASYVALFMVTGSKCPYKNFCSTSIFDL